jgi:hypothetical protein
MSCFKAKDERKARVPTSMKVFSSALANGAGKAGVTVTHQYRDTPVDLKRPSAWSGSAMRDSIVATDLKIGFAIRMPWRWPFAACRAFARCCLWAFRLAERRLPAA